MATIRPRKPGSHLAHDDVALAEGFNEILEGLDGDTDELGNTPDPDEQAKLMRNPIYMWATAIYELARLRMQADNAPPDALPSCMVEIAMLPALNPTAGAGMLMALAVMLVEKDQFTGDDPLREALAEVGASRAVLLEEYLGEMLTTGFREETRNHAKPN